MHLSAYAHLKNKYPGAHIQCSESAIDVHDAEGHRVALRKNGAGQWVDVGEQLGCVDKFCLAPIPKNARAFKLYAGGKVAESEEHEERSEVAAKLADAHGGRVPSLAELAKAGAKIDQAGNVDLDEKRA